MKTGQIRTVEIFCSYSHKDETLWKELEKHLSSLKRRGLISAWHHYAVQPGQEWEQEVKQHLSTAQIILLLISPDFLASDQCYSVEMMQAMQRHEAGDARIIPIILRHVYWEAEPFSKLQVLPAGGKPVKSWADRDEVFSNITKQLQRITTQIRREHFLAEAIQLDKEGKHAEAYLICEQGLNIDRDASTSWFITANILMNCQRYEEALAAYEEALRLEPGIADLYFYQNKAHALKCLGRYEEALAAYEVTIGLCAPDSDPDLYSDLWHNKAIVLRRLAEQASEMAKQFRQGVSHGTPS